MQNSETLRPLLAQEIINRLNQITLDDPKAMNALFSYRVPCNQKLVDHPTVVCLDNTVGILGILNGLLSDILNTRIAAVVEDENDKIIKFQEYNQK